MNVYDIGISDEQYIGILSLRLYDAATENSITDMLNKNSVDYAIDVHLTINIRVIKSDYYKAFGLIDNMNKELKERCIAIYRINIP